MSGADIPGGEDRESTPILLSRVSRVSIEPPSSNRRTTVQEATPPLAGVDWVNPTRRAQWLGRAGLLVSVVLLFVAVFADIFASNLPIMCKVHGSVYLFPNITHPAALETMGPQALSEQADWMLRPLVFHGPTLSPNEATSPLRGPWAVPGHPLGTDREGNDIFARAVHGARSYLVFALAATAASLLLGVFLGAVAGLFGGPVDTLVSRIVESVSAFPPLVLVLGIQAAVPHANIFTLFLAIAVTRWPEIARLVRGDVIQATTRDYVLAARALGASPFRILRKHIMPNVRAKMVVVAAAGVSGVVLTEASLDFLRVGTPAGAASWGETMSQFRDAPESWWLLAFPGALLVLTIVSFNVMGEALRSALEPRSR